MLTDDSPILVSACLLGLCCRYNAEPVTNEYILALAKTHPLVPVCPEQLGGLPTPRPPAERKGERVVTSNGTDVTNAFIKGAEETLLLARMLGCKTAVLKARSPSCGHGRIYDGTFTGKIVPGSGVAAELLEAGGITVYSEEELPSLID